MVGNKGSIGLMFRIDLFTQHFIISLNNCYLMDGSTNQYQLNFDWIICDITHIWGRESAKPI